MSSQSPTADILELLTSDLDKRLGISGSDENGGKASLHSIVEACDKVEVASVDIGPGGRLSVAASLPAVAAAGSACSADLRKTLGNVLTFITGEEVLPSDVKDWSLVEDALDGLYARIDEALAAGAGTDRRKSLTPASTIIDSVPDNDRPQNQWADLIDNSRTHFVPILKEKPNAIVPLDPLILRAQTDRSITTDFGNVYEREIVKSVGELRKNNDLQFREVVDFDDLDTTDIVLVDTVERLDEMIQEIESHHSEIAIDLEHHDIHSYRGFTCLIQISSRSRDYIVDPFPLFHELGSRLNKITTNPNIIKVLHGADMDIQWLQRDFGVYVVNMFDTGQAARVLGLAGGFGLANLLDTFCKVSTNKKFQTSDWRIRPIPSDMLRYARIDTHYLLFIFDKLWNSLLALGGGSVSDNVVSSYGKKMLIQVVEKSAGIASKVWKDHGSDYANEAVQLCLKSPAIRVGSIRHNPRAMTVLRAVLQWRDETARVLDESKHFVLSNAAVLRLTAAQPPSSAQILRHLSFEKGNSFMPAMRITTEMADQLMAKILSEIESESVIEDRSITVESTPSMTTTTDDGRSRKSVVSAGRESFGKVEKSVRRISESVVKNVQDVLPTEPVTSALFDIFTANSRMMIEEDQSGHATPRGAILEAIAHYLASVPASVKADLDAWVAAGCETPQEEPDTEMTEKPLVTEFVPFHTSTKTERRKNNIDWENGEMPLTISEDRRRESSSSVNGQKLAKKNKKNSAVESGKHAAIKALEFIESELSLGRKRNS